MADRRAVGGEAGRVPPVGDGQVFGGVMADLCGATNEGKLIGGAAKHGFTGVRSPECLEEGVHSPYRICFCAHERFHWQGFRECPDYPDRAPR